MRARTVIALAPGALGLFLLAATPAHGGSTIPMPGSRDSHKPPAPTSGPTSGRAREFDASGWGSLLQKYLQGGRIDYAAWKKDGTKELDRLLAAMSQHPYRTVFAKEARVAFLINAYNAFSVRQILAAYPVASVTEIPGFRDRATLPLDGGAFTLDQIENELMAPIASQEPRFHLALSRSALGAPPLHPTPLVGDSLSLQLERIMLDFVRDPARNRFRSEEPDTMFLSEFFQWFRRDFESGDDTLVRRLAPNFSLGEMMKMMREEPPIAWLPLDWRLNDIARTVSGSDGPGPHGSGQ